MNNLEKLITFAGSQSALARSLGLAQGHVWNWINKQGGKIPAEYVVAASRSVNWLVTPHQLRPDIYPHPEDGLPTDLRQKAG